MRLRTKLIVGAAALATPLAGMFVTPAQAVSGPCEVTLGNPPPYVGAPSASVDPNTGEVRFKPGRVDTGSPAPRVRCFGGLIAL